MLEFSYDPSAAFDTTGTRGSGDICGAFDGSGRGGTGGDHPQQVLIIRSSPTG
jgi:hypothetical protein